MHNVFRISILAFIGSLFFGGCLNVEHSYTKLAPGSWRAVLELEPHERLAMKKNEVTRVTEDFHPGDLAFKFEPSPTPAAIKPMDYLNQLQWPAMVVTVIAAWLIGSQSKRKRKIGFWCFLLSNLLWVIWGWHDQAYALVVLQIALAILNIRGAYKNEPDSTANSKA